MAYRCSCCYSKFTSYDELRSHESICITTLLGDHHRNSNGNSNRIKREYTCPFCNKEWLTYSGSYKIHIRHCHNNPDRIPAKSHIQTETSREKFLNQ